MSRRTVGLGVLAACLATVPTAVASTPSAMQVVTVARIALGHAVPAGFLGLSIEYWALEAYAGQDPQAVNPVLLQLIRNLSPGQSPNLRIGGVTSDRTWWPVSGFKRPAGVNYNLTPRRLEVMKSIAGALGARFILGVNFEADSSKLAAAEAAAQLSALGRGSVAALELGNEPELYGTWDWYRNAQGRGTPGRSVGYGFPSFTRDFARISAALPPGPVAGPASGSHLWLSSLGRLIAVAPRLRVVTMHLYPLQACYFPTTSPRYPTVADLLAPISSVGLANGVAPYVAVAHAHRLPFRVDEMNTVSCGAAPGLTDSFAQALWSLDALFADVQTGIDGVNMHTYPGATYQLFKFNRAGGAWQAFVEPEYYGLLMFAQAAPAGSRLLGITGASPTLRAWATLAPDGKVRVLLINDDTARAHAVTVRVPGASTTATLTRLQAPSVRATYDVTLGGQSFGRRSATGLLAGPRREDSVARASGGYGVRLAAASAAMLTLG